MVRHTIPKFVKCFVHIPPLILRIAINLYQLPMLVDHTVPLQLISQKKKSIFVVKFAVFEHSLVPASLAFWRVVETDLTLPPHLIVLPKPDVLVFLAMQLPEPIFHIVFELALIKFSAFSYPFDRPM